VRFAAVVTDRGYSAARMGLGAVLGAKNCKAVVVAGGEEPVAAHPTALARLTGEYVSVITRNPLTSKQHDPSGFGAWPAEGLEGYLGVRNYTTARAHLPGFEASAFLARLGRSTGGCPGCPQDCLKSFADDSGVLHQEAVAAFAGTLGIADLDAVLQLNRWCHRQGVNPMSLAGVLAFRCELAERGLVAGPAFGDTERCGRLPVKSCAAVDSARCWPTVWRERPRPPVLRPSAMPCTAKGSSCAGSTRGVRRASRWRTRCTRSGRATTAWSTTSTSIQWTATSSSSRVHATWAARPAACRWTRSTRRRSSWWRT
jgi:hypothetical protein